MDYSKLTNKELLNRWRQDHDEAAADELLDRQSEPPQPDPEPDSNAVCGTEMSSRW